MINPNSSGSASSYSYSLRSVVVWKRTIKWIDCAIPTQIHQIDHNVNKLFSWLLSEAHKCHKSSADRDTIKLTIYLTALLSALQMAIDRKQEVQGLERLLNEICLPLLLSAVPSSGDHPFSISLQVALECDRVNSFHLFPLELRRNKGKPLASM